MELRRASAETDRRFQETAAQMKESSADFDRRFQKTEKAIAALSKNIGGLNNSLGDLVEKMFAAQIWSKFDALGYRFTVGKNAVFLEDNQPVAEADVFLENGDYAMPVEVKTRLKEQDVDEHIERIERIRAYMDRRGDKRRLIGTVAGAVVSENVRLYAQKRGLYVLQQSGESVSLAKAPTGFKAREWQASPA
jgi:hypothetical protein